MGFWAFIKAVVKFAVVAMTGFEVADVLKQNELHEAEAEMKKQFESLKNEMTTFKFNGFDDAKMLLIIILVVVSFMLAVWIFSIMKSCASKFLKKSVSA